MTIIESRILVKTRLVKKEDLDTGEGREIEGKKRDLHADSSDRFRFIAEAGGV